MVLIELRNENGGRWEERLKEGLMKDRVCVPYCTRSALGSCVPGDIGM